MDREKLKESILKMLDSQDFADFQFGLYDEYLNSPNKDNKKEVDKELDHLVDRFFKL